jgi:hypothetical protein
MFSIDMDVGYLLLDLRLVLATIYFRGIAVRKRKVVWTGDHRYWKVARCDNQHSVTHGNRVMNRSSLGKGKDRQQVVVGKSSGKSDTVQRSKVQSLYPAWSFDM